MPARGHAARTTEDLLTLVLERLERLETRTRVVVGPPGHAWVVEVNPAGELIARHAETGAVTVLAAP